MLIRMSAVDYVAAMNWSIHNQIDFTPINLIASGKKTAFIINDNCFDVADVITRVNDAIVLYPSECHVLARLVSKSTADTAAFLLRWLSQCDYYSDD